MRLVAVHTRTRSPVSVLHGSSKSVKHDKRLAPLGDSLLLRGARDGKKKLENRIQTDLHDSVGEVSQGTFPSSSASFWILALFS